MAASAAASLWAGAELSVSSLALLCEAGSLEEVSRVLRSDAEDDDEESLRRAALSCAGDEVVLLIAWVLLSTSEPNESVVEVSFELCDRAGFCCALETCTLAARSDDTPTTGDPSETSSASGEQGAGQSRVANIYQIKSTG